ncbi:hypothetical protein [Pontixanthobacter sp. CEM42]|uniref:hypothetical protein n=1 Tax=Pontixanthobacter sp. CEM42 TaxID=2792077 RepID=UPI001FD74AA0|nr:hypothetical protein [Pontixanthobacter sp. CEM42]
MTIETTSGARTAIENTRFFVKMAAIMTAVVVLGFVINLLMGRSSFDAPWQYHLHGVLFMSWLGFYLVQHITAARGNFVLHAQLGKAAYLFIPAMVGAGLLIMVTVARRNGGPFFFNVSEFLISNSALLLCFGVLSIWALRVQRNIGWHRRLMLCAMAILTGPGLGRLIPAPILIPYAWFIITAVTWVFPLIGMVVDKRARGKVHPAYYWGLGLYVGAFAVSLAIAYSPIGMGITEWVIEGSNGANRPIEAFLPPGFSM